MKAPPAFFGILLSGFAVELPAGKRRSLALEACRNFSIGPDGGTSTDNVSSQLWFITLSSDIRAVADDEFLRLVIVLDFSGPASSLGSELPFFTPSLCVEPHQIYNKSYKLMRPPNRKRVSCSILQQMHIRHPHFGGCLAFEARFADVPIPEDTWVCKAFSNRIFLPSASYNRYDTSIYAHASSPAKHALGFFEGIDERFFGKLCLNVFYKTITFCR